MAVIYLPQRVAFTAAIAAGAGGVAQATYTVPANRTAIVKHIWLQMNANAATLGTGLLRALVAVNTAASVLNLSVNGTVLALETDIYLVGGEQAILFTNGGAAAAIQMSGSIYILEAQE